MWPVIGVLLWVYLIHVPRLSICNLVHIYMPEHTRVSCDICITHPADADSRLQGLYGPYSLIAALHSVSVVGSAEAGTVRTQVGVAFYTQLLKKDDLEALLRSVWLKLCGAMPMKQRCRQSA